MINNKKIQSLYTNFLDISIGVIIALSHNINQRLKMFDHITFQTESAPFQFKAAIADKNNSGADVHAAIIVSQINSADTLKYFATLTLELIKWFAANHSISNQTINRINAPIMSSDLKIKNMKNRL